MPPNRTILYPEDTLLKQINEKGIYLTLRDVNIYGYYSKKINIGSKASMES